MIAVIAAQSGDFAAELDLFGGYKLPVGAGTLDTGITFVQFSCWNQKKSARGRPSGS